MRENGLKGKKERHSSGETTKMAKNSFFQPFQNSWKTQIFETLLYKLVEYNSHSSNIYIYIERERERKTDPIYPTPPLGQGMTQGQFLSGV